MTNQQFEDEQIRSKIAELNLALLELRKHYENLAQSFHQICSSEPSLNHNDLSFYKCNNVTCKGFIKVLEVTKV